MGDNASAGSLIVYALAGLSWANLLGTSIIESKRYVGYSVAVNIACSIVLIHTGTYTVSQVFSARSEQFKKSENNRLIEKQKLGRWWLEVSKVEKTRKLLQVMKV